MTMYNNAIREKYRNDYHDYLSERLAKEHLALGNDVLSESTIKTYITDTFFLEKNTDIDFMHWYTSPKTLESSKDSLKKLLCKRKGNSTPKKLANDINNYYTDMCWFRDFLIEKGYIPDCKERWFVKR